MEYPGPWPPRSASVPPSGAPAATAASVAVGSSWAQSGGPFGPEAASGDGRGKLVTFALLAGALVIAGVVAVARTRDSSGEAEGTDLEALETTGTSPATEAPAATATPASDAPSGVQVGELFTGTAIATLIGEIAVANGTEPIRILSVLVYPEYLTAQVRGPGAEESIVEYRWAGQLEPAVPPQVLPSDDLAAGLFGSDEVDWSAIPALVEAAPGAVTIVGGVVTHLDVERSLPFSADVRIRVFVSGPGGDGFVDGDAMGSMISINGN